MLTVQLERDYTQGEIFRFKVVYEGTPQYSDYWSFGFAEVSEKPMIWALSRAVGSEELVAM